METIGILSLSVGALAATGAEVSKVPKQTERLQMRKRNIQASDKY